MKPAFMQDKHFMAYYWFSHGYTTASLEMGMDRQEVDGRDL